MCGQVISYNPKPFIKPIEIVKFVYRDSGIDKSNEFFVLFRDSAKLIGQFPRNGYRIYPNAVFEFRQAPIPQPYRSYIIYRKADGDTAIIKSVWHESKDVLPLNVLQ